MTDLDTTCDNPTADGAWLLGRHRAQLDRQLLLLLLLWYSPRILLHDSRAGRRAGGTYVSQT